MLESYTPQTCPIARTLNPASWVCQFFAKVDSFAKRLGRSVLSTAQCTFANATCIFNPTPKLTKTHTHIAVHTHRHTHLAGQVQILISCSWAHTHRTQTFTHHLTSCTFTPTQTTYGAKHLMTAETKHLDDQCAKMSY